MNFETHLLVFVHVFKDILITHRSYICVLKCVFLKMYTKSDAHQAVDISHFWIWVAAAIWFDLMPDFKISVCFFMRACD